MTRPAVLPDPDGAVSKRRPQPGQPPDQDPATTPAADSAALPSLHGDDYDLLYEQVYLAQRRAPRRMSRIPRLVAGSTVLVWRTSHLQTSAIMLAQLVTAGFAALQVVLGGYAIREVLSAHGNRSIAQLAVPLLLLTLVSTAGTLTSSGSSQFGRLLGARVQRAVSERVLDVTSAVDLITYDDANFHDQLSRILVNVPTIPFQVVTCLASLVGGVAGVVALTVSLLLIQPILVPILLIGGIPLWFLSRRGGRLEFDFAVAQTASIREREYLQETLSRREEAAELRAYGTAGVLRHRWNALYDVFLAALRVQVRRRYVLSALTGLASGIVLILTLLLLVELIHTGSIGFGQAGAAAIAIRLLSGRLQQLISGLSSLFQSALFLDDYEAFLGRRRSQDPAGTTGPAAEPFRGLQVEDVCFRYPNTTVDALHGVSLTLRPGEIVALVGENGSGKTTLAKNLAGLYEPSAGRMALNGRGVGAGDSARIREHVALVLQDFTHYALSAAENISFGRPDVPADRDRVEEAAKRVGADAFLAQLPAGYDTRLSRIFKDGRELSLGQWQRVALARAFYRNAPIVILDEPTAALDPRAEAQLYDSVRSVLAGRTVVLITHRLASVRGADRILVMQHGQIVEQGNHEQLLRADGLYAELVSLQSNRHIGSAARLDENGSTERVGT